MYFSFIFALVIFKSNPDSSDTLGSNWRHAIFEKSHHRQKLFDQYFSLYSNMLGRVDHKLCGCQDDLP